MIVLVTCAVIILVVGGGAAAAFELLRGNVKAPAVPNTSPVASRPLSPSARRPTADDVFTSWPGSCMAVSKSSLPPQVRNIPPTKHYSKRPGYLVCRYSDLNTSSGVHLEVTISMYSSPSDAMQQYTEDESNDIGNSIPSADPVSGIGDKAFAGRYTDEIIAGPNEHNLHIWDIGGAQVEAVARNATIEVDWGGSTGYPNPGARTFSGHDLAYATTRPQAITVCKAFLATLR
jgi:hypothetical protein